MAAADLKVWEVKEPYLDLHCQLGEGPYYEKDTHSLRFVDIRQKRLHTIDLAAGSSSLKTLQLDSTIGVTADIQGVDPADKLAVGLKYGLAVLDRKTGQYEYVAKFKDSDSREKRSDYERIRANDGAADPHGRFWLGCMTDFDLGEFQPEGGLFRFDHGQSGALVRPELTIPNALGWSPDGRTMYFTHTPQRTVFAFDYDPVDGRLSNERALYVHPTGEGWPDGFRVDVEGYIWHAVYGGGRVIRISPDGRVVAEVRLPTRNITCPQFVGTELFITSAEDEIAEDGPLSKALGGALFRVDVGVEGVPLYKVRLDV